MTKAKRRERSKAQPLVASNRERTQMTDRTDRTAYIAGLRRLAYRLEDHPELALPYAAGTRPRSEATSAPIRFWLHDLDDFVAALDALELLFEEGEQDGLHWRVDGWLAGLHYEVMLFNAVDHLDRVQVGGTPVYEYRLPARDLEAVR